MQMKMTRSMLTLDTLPRSIRWRIQLGLLSCPPTDSWTMEELIAENEDTCSQQRDYFQHFYELHFDALQYALYPPTQENSVDDTLDPLSQLVRQQEVEHAKWEAVQRKETQRRESYATGRHEAIPFSSTEILKVVSKDINRLDPEHATYTYSRLNWQHHDREQLESHHAEPTFQDAINQRKEQLTKLLHIYAKECPHPGGYQQGMHEVCSYVLLVIEMDNFDCETSAEGNCYGELLQSNNILVDSYTLFSRILKVMAPCYHGNLEVMAQAIRSKIFHVAPSNDEETSDLFKALQKLPLELYCARWTRLLFAREFKGWRLVLEVWDELMSLTSVVGVEKWNLMIVLEMMAASKIWMEREVFLQEDTMDEGFQKLLQQDPMDHVEPLISTLATGLQQLAAADNIKRVPGVQRQANRRSSFSDAINSTIEQTQKFRESIAMPLKTLRSSQRLRRTMSLKPETERPSRRRATWTSEKLIILQMECDSDSEKSQTAVDPSSSQYFNDFLYNSNSDDSMGSLGNSASGVLVVDF